MKRCGGRARWTTKACTGSRSRSGMTTSRAARQIAAAARTPVQIGENFSQVHDMQKAIDAGACDYVMPDLERIGGVTGWQRASALAAHSRSADVIASLSRSQCAPARCDADRALARIRGLDESVAHGAADDRATGRPFRPASPALGWPGTTKWCGAMRKFSDIDARMCATRTILLALLITAVAGRPDAD